jgi:hypothetical protein
MDVPLLDRKEGSASHFLTVWNPSTDPDRRVEIN